jgi:hypothetical protein
MFGVILKTLFALAILGMMFLGLKSFGGVEAITSAIAHFQSAFDFLVLNIKTLSSVFPWVVDAVLIFTALLAIEFIVMSFKVWNFLHKKVI